MTGRSIDWQIDPHPHLKPARCTMSCPSASSQAITRRTVRSLMLALRAIVAADGQQPVPSSREQASARASRTRRSLPEVGEFAHTQFITAMLIALGSVVSDSGSRLGAGSGCDSCPDTVVVDERRLLTWANADVQGVRGAQRLVRDEEAAGSNPVTPTLSSLRT
jgi:hypothetical protein